MARKVLLETTYTFTPSTRTITFPRIILRERLVLITNVSTNQVIYNFSDPNLRATSYSTSTSAAGVETTTVVLNYNTSSMSSSDKLQITIDEFDERFTPAETLTDPVGKLRVSEPQALIDTDFEYGTQATKWESVSLLNNKASVFFDPTTPLTFTDISGTGTRTVTVATNTPPSVGTPVFIQESTNTIANGWYLVETVGAGSTNFTYTARANVTNGSMLDTTKTFIYSGNFFTAASIPVSASAGAAFSASGTLITVTTTNAHGLTVGDGIYVKDTSGATPAINGSWTVRTVPTSNTFTFDVVSSTTGTITASGGSQNLYQRPFGSTVHRPYDGGVNFTAGTPYHGNQLVRQTRRYFRYQSGKGIQFSTGTILRPAFQVDSLTSSGTTVTVTTKFPHNLGTTGVGVNPTVTVSGAVQSAYNGTFTVASVPSDTTFTYIAGSTPAASPATGFPITVTPTNWWGSRIRAGMFDELNGFFYEYDGQTLYAVRRTSTDQLTGTVSVTSGSPVVTGTNTRFADQVTPGEYVVMRGMPYMVVSVTSNTQMIVSPEYRGATIPGNLIIAKRTDTRAAQSTWNIDRCDGTGPSGYSVDLSRMQMLYIDYSWYGAGVIRFGFRNQRGDIIYCHRIPNANYRTEAYMRSGNLPARYECNTQPPFTNLTATLANAATSMSVADTTFFPSSGYLVVQAAGNTGATVEYMSYTGKTATTFTGLTRALTNISGPLGLTNMGGTSTGGGGTFTFSATAPIQVSLHNATFTPTLSHWGSSVIMDGKFDDDKSFIFTNGMPAPIGITSSTTNALLSIRLAPSVDNSLPGVLGAREVVNRMQLTLRSMGILANGQFLVSLVLNGRVSSGTFSSAGGSSLCQIAQHAPGTTITGGETIYAFYSNNGGGTNFDVTTADLGLVRDLGNSILGGAATNACPTTPNNLYPDGPDVVTIIARNIGTATANIAARLSWTEAQA